MKIDIKTPPREYICGLLSEVIISDLGTINLTCGNTFNIANDFCSLSMKCKFWGYEIQIKPKCSGSVLISGASWKRSHFMFCALKETKQFTDYFHSEKHHLFWTVDVGEAVFHPSLEVDHACLKNDEQFTFCSEGKHDLDITSKSWGFYLTPSLFSRCKKFNLNPFFLKSETGCKIFMVFSDFEKNFRQIHHEYEIGVLYRIDEKSGICISNVP